MKAGVTPRAVVILAAVANEAARLNKPAEVVITSVTDGKHKTGSLHYTGAAVDVRSKNFHSHDDKVLFLQRLLDRLGPEYEGFLEAENTPNEHFHVEYDPK